MKLLVYIENHSQTFHK